MADEFELDATLEELFSWVDKKHTCTRPPNSFTLDEYYAHYQEGGGKFGRDSVRKKLKRMVDEGLLEFTRVPLPPDCKRQYIYIRVEDS